MESKKDKREKHSDTMRIDIRPEDVQREKSKKKIYVPRKSAREESKETRSSTEGGRCKKLGGEAFQKLLHNIYDAVLVTDLEGNVLNANERATIFFRCDADYLCSRQMSNLISGADGSLIPTILKNLEEDRFTLIQASCIRKDETTFPSEISANRINLSGTKCISFFIRDVTLRRAQEEQLRTGYYAIQNAGSGIAITDPDGFITYSNPAMQQLVGAGKPEDLQGNNLKQFFVDEVFEEALESLQTNSSWNGELELAGFKGESSYVHTTIVKNISTENMLTGYIFSFMDVSKEREAKIKLEAYADELSRKNESMRKDLEMARDIQRALLPRKYPVYTIGDEKEPVLDFGHIYIPSGDIGGDFFDVIPLSEKRVGLFMADVSGHGMRAALITATLRGMVEEEAGAARDPSEFMSRINNAYCSIFEIAEDFCFVTAVYGILDVTTGVLEMSIAGHPEPIVIHANNSASRIELTGSSMSPAIGLVGKQNVTYEKSEVLLESGDVFLFYTDGIFEEEGPSREEYGLERLEERLSRNRASTLDDMLDGVVSDVRRVTGKKEFVDDVCMLAIAFDRSGHMSASS